MSHPLRRALMAVALGVAAMGSGCANPQWRSDDYTVDGTLEGTTCRMTVDGHTLTARDGQFSETILIQRDPGARSQLPPGQGLNSVYCLGLQLLIVAPVGTFPPPGRYRAVGPLVSDPGVVTVRVYFRGVREGSWPFAFTGVHLEAKDGFLQLDEMTSNSARGTFRAVMRRQPNGS
jgi:hypothetical protein